MLRRLLITAGLGACLLVAQGKAQEPPEPVAAATAESATPAAGVPAKDAHAVVEQALKFLATDRLDLVQVKACVNCHHAPLRSWAMREAARQGFAVDTAELEQTTDLQLAKLLKLAENYQGSQWGHSLSMFYVLGEDPAKLSPERVKIFDELAQIILGRQTEQGTWLAAGQFANQRRPAGESEQVMTLWGVLALTRLAPREGTDAARTKALQWLKTSTPGTTIDARVLRLLVERQLGDPERAAELLAQLLAARHDDGGWGWQVADPSDAWATGLALYALSEVRTDSAQRELLAEPIQQARDFLAQTQLENGSWLVEKKLNSTKDSSMSSYFGTVWAVIGIARTGE